MKKERTELAASCLALARDLAGIVDSLPADLSTQRRHPRRRDIEAFKELASRIRRRLGSRQHSDSAALVAKDRKR